MVDLLSLMWHRCVVCGKWIFSYFYHLQRGEWRALIFVCRVHVGGWLLEIGWHCGVIPWNEFVGLLHESCIQALLRVIDWSMDWVLNVDGKLRKLSLPTIDLVLETTLFYHNCAIFWHSELLLPCLKSCTLRWWETTLMVSHWCLTSRLS